MTRKGSAIVRAALLGTFCLLPPLTFAQEEPELIPTQPVKPPEKPAADSTPPATASGPLRPALDFQRWREMTARERQTFVEGAIQAISTTILEMRTDLAVDGRVPPDSLAAVVRFVHDRYPRFPPGDYLREMESIYLKSDGQNLTMKECFEQAFRRINAR